MDRVKGSVNVHAAFGDTNRADGVPYHLVPAGGPVYLEGRLVLSLSFQGEPIYAQLIDDDEELLERYRLWDDLAESWFGEDLEVLRYEQVDAVIRRKPDLSVLWRGAVDTCARVVPVPDLDVEGMAVNAGLDLCWRRV